MGISIGYVSTWNGTWLINDTTRFATKYTGNGLIVKPRIVVLPDGTKVSYDGTSTSPSSPGRLTQEFYDTEGPTFLDSLHGQLGKVSTVVLRESENAGANTDSAQAILVMVKDVTPIQGKRSRVWGEVTWEIIGDWS